MSAKSICNSLSQLKSFFEKCQRYQIIDITNKNLIFQEDFPKRVEACVKDIPLYVLKQLDDNLYRLAKPIATTIKILRETGMRISEVCSLDLNCIQMDGSGDWWLYTYLRKVKKENLLYISKELAESILEQQSYIKNHLGSGFTSLFCETECHTYFEKYGNKQNTNFRREVDYFVPIKKNIAHDTLRGYIRQLAYDCNITDASGTIYPIWKCHQFRHTHLTDLARKGMGISHIMQRSGHKSPQMPMRYIHLTNEDQKKKMKEVWDNTHFNLEGEVVASPNPDLDTADLQWVKKGMNVQTSDNGYCTLLFTQTCPHQNLPCKECGSWVTTLEFLGAHQKELEETEKIIENARAKGWQRQVEKDVPRAERLKKIIDGMKKHKTMKGLGHNDWEKEGDNDSK